MSGFIVVAFAGLLVQQAVPHPSTQEPYRAPVIRPFEPTSDFGREPAQGDAEEEARRRPLEAPVAVGAYVRSYEFTPGDTETAYDQGVTSAELRADQTAGPLDGRWRIVDAGGRTLHELVLNDPGVGPVEGGWRDGGDAGAAAWDGESLRLEGLGVILLEAGPTGWRGVMTTGGRSRPVTLTRPD